MVVPGWGLGPSHRMGGTILPDTNTGMKTVFESECAKGAEKALFREIVVQKDVFRESTLSSGVSILLFAFEVSFQIVRNLVPNP